MRDRLSLDLPDLAATRALAARLASVLRCGDIVALRGDLGVGKSELARGVIRGLAGVDLEVPSPTFTIIQDYRLDSLIIRHVDLYRIGDPNELGELGLDEAPARDEVWLVEWPERAEGRLSGRILHITLEEGNDPEARTAYLEGDQAWAQRIGSLAP